MATIVTLVLILTISITIMSIIYIRCAWRTEPDTLVNESFAFCPDITEPTPAKRMAARIYHQMTDVQKMRYVLDTYFMNERSPTKMADLLETQHIINSDV